MYMRPEKPSILEEHTVHGVRADLPECLLMYSMVAGTPFEW